MEQISYHARTQQHLVGRIRLSKPEKIIFEHSTSYMLFCNPAIEHKINDVITFT